MIKIKRAIDLFRLDKFQLIKKINTLELENSVLEQTIIMMKHIKYSWIN